MIFKERYQDILKTEEDIAKIFGDNYRLENNVISTINVVVKGHFGDAVSLELICNDAQPFPFYNLVTNVGYILRALVEIFDKGDDNSVNIIKALAGTPIRIVYDTKAKYSGNSVAIGHFMEDRFVLIDDLLKQSK